MDVNKVNSLNMFGRVTKCLGRICLNLSDIGHSKIQWYSSPRTPHVLHKRALYTNLFLLLLNKTLGRLWFFVRNFVSAILCLSGIGKRYMQILIQHTTRPLAYNSKPLLHILVTQSLLTRSYKIKLTRYKHIYMCLLPFGDVLF